MEKILDLFIVLILVAGLFMAGKGMINRVQRDMARSTPGYALVRIIS